MGETSGVNGTLDVTVVDAAGSAGGLSVNPYPAGAVPQTATSYQVANTAASASIPGTAGKTSYLTNALITAAGSTAGAAVQGSITGINPTPIAFVFVFPTGVLVGAQPLELTFDPPLQATGLNTAIVVSLPAGGSGNTAACVSVTGFQL